MTKILRFTFVSNVEVIFQPTEYGQGWNHIELENANGSEAWSIWELDPQGKGQDSFITVSLYQRDGKAILTAVTKEQYETFKRKKLYARPVLATLIDI